MIDTEPGPTPRRRPNAKTVGLVAAGVLAGGIIAATAGASAATSSPSAPSAATAPGAAANGARVAGPAGHGGATPVRGDEKSVSSADAAALKAAALKAVPGGAVYRVETDAGDGKFEVHMTKADGTPVTVKFDKNLALIKVEDGMGTGDPALAGQPRPGG
jgi:hypothetical protein